MLVLFCFCKGLVLFAKVNIHNIHTTPLLTRKHDAQEKVRYLVELFDGDYDGCLLVVVKIIPDASRINKDEP